MPRAFSTKRFAPWALMAMLIAPWVDGRVWTDVSGRELEAEFLALDQDHVRVRRATDGRVFSIPLERLCAGDQAYAATRGQGADAVETSAETAPFAGLAWPRRVGLPDNYEVEVVREDNAAGEYVYRTPHFEFHSDVKLARKVVREFGKIFEATLAAMQAFPLDWNPRMPEARFQTRLFGARADYHQAGGMMNSGGVYIPSMREIWVPLSSLGVEKSSSGFTLDDSREHATLVHEITHQVHHDWLSRLPPWMIEGMAVYMESVPYERGVFRFDQRDLEDFSARRGRAQGEALLVGLEELMTMDQAMWNANFEDHPEDLRQYYFSAFLLLNYFLHHDGDGRRIDAYCRALESGQSEAEARACLLDGRTYGELFEEMDRAYKREDLKLHTLGSPR